MENGRHNFAGGLSDQPLSGAHGGKSSSRLAAGDPDAGHRRLHGRPADLGRNAVGYATPSRLAAFAPGQCLRKMNSHSSGRQFTEVGAVALTATLGGCVMTPTN